MRRREPAGQLRGHREDAEGAEGAQKDGGCVTGAEQGGLGGLLIIT